MKTLILYATKHGATLKIAESLAKHIGDAALRDINGGGDISLLDYGCVILGSYLTAGEIHKKMKDFAAKNTAELQTKRLGLFVSGLQSEGEAVYLSRNFPPELLEAARAKAFLGGVFDPEKCGFVARTIIKAVAKLDSYTSTIDEGKIKEFSEMLID